MKPIPQFGLPVVDQVFNLAGGAVEYDPLARAVCLPLKRRAV